MIFATLLLSACLVPANVTLHPSLSTYCDLWSKVETQWKEAQARRWMAAYVMGQPFVELKIEDAGPLVIQEMLFMFTLPVADAGPVIGGWYDGMFWPEAVPRIQFNGRHDAADYPILMHELAHLQGYLQKQDGWGDLGHGTDADPYVKAANFLTAWMNPYGERHPYYPGRLGKVVPHRSTPVLLCFRAMGTEARTRTPTPKN